jgi:hypothetical protein
VLPTSQMFDLGDFNTIAPPGAAGHPVAVECNSRRRPQWRRPWTCHGLVIDLSRTKGIRVDPPRPRQSALEQGVSGAM